MDLTIWLNKYVEIDLSNSTFYYKGLVLNADSNSITIRDLKGKIVQLKEMSIASIKEAKNGTDNKS